MENPRVVHRNMGRNKRWEAPSKLGWGEAAENMATHMYEKVEVYSVLRE